MLSFVFQVIVVDGDLVGQELNFLKSRCFFCHILYLDVRRANVASSRTVTCTWLFSCSFVFTATEILRRGNSTFIPSETQPDSFFWQKIYFYRRRLSDPQACSLKTWKLTLRITIHVSIAANDSHPREPEGPEKARVSALPALSLSGIWRRLVVPRELPGGL